MCRSFVESFSVVVKVSGARVPIVDVFLGARVPEGVVFSDARVPEGVVFSVARVPYVVVIPGAHTPDVVVIPSVRYRAARGFRLARPGPQGMAGTQNPAVVWLESPWASTARTACSPWER